MNKGWLCNYNYFYDCLFSDVHVVLVTDCLVLLTEKDQKLNIAGLLDSKVRLSLSVCMVVLSSPPVSCDQAI